MANSFAATYYVAPTGSDANDGSIEHPFATVQRGQTAVAPGDTIYLRGGTYTPAMDQIARTMGAYALFTDLNKSGTAEAPIHYFAYPGEKPVFDFSKIRPNGQRVTAFYVSGNFIHLKGFEVTGVQVTVLGHTQSECFRVVGSNNTFEQLAMHDGMAIGLYLTAGSNNLILNCDAYRNWDNYSEGDKGGNVDGFGGHPAKGGTGNVFRGCRAWFNSDDGYDCINSAEAVTFENCWAFYNGYSTEFRSLGDGNGFKGGGYGATAVNRLPNPIPRHVVRFCLAVGNKANGFYGNHHIGGDDWISNTAYKNGVNFNMLARLDNNATDVPGYGHVMKNNLGYKGGTEVFNLSPENNEVSHNYFDLNLVATAEDFQSLDESQLTAPRQENGDLPNIAFMHLVNASKFIDKGVYANFPYYGAAPELGAFEDAYINVPNFSFEQPATTDVAYHPAEAAWTFGGTGASGAGISAGNGALMRDNPKPAEGAQAGVLPGTTTLSQALNGFVTGGSYEIIFSAAQRKTTGAKGQTWDVKIGDKVLASFAPSTSATDFAEYTAKFTATAPSQTLAFVGTNTRGGDNTIFLDNIRIRQTAYTTPPATPETKAGERSPRN
jgi:hypothetical protein